MRTLPHLYTPRIATPARHPKLAGNVEHYSCNLFISCYNVCLQSAVQGHEDSSEGGSLVAGGVSVESAT